MKRSKMAYNFNSLLAILFTSLLSITTAHGQSDNVFSDASCMKSHPADSCFTTLSWANGDQYIFLSQDTTIAINHPDSRFFLRYRKIHDFTIIEVITPKTDESLSIRLEESTDHSGFKNLSYNQKRENHEFAGYGISGKTGNDKRVVRLSSVLQDTFVYLYFKSKS